jgi:catechol 2,3-dioxygenase-like lactoylglutathione lyase family enzyme
MAVRIDRFMHVNVNCSELPRALSFYRDFVGLHAESHTHPVPQAGTGFGMSGSVQWDAYILHDHRGFAGPAVDLLEWKQPRPVGSPYPVPNHLGLATIGVAAPALDAVVAAATRLGIECGEIARAPIEGEEPRRLLHCSDPDGTRIRFVEAPDQETALRLAHVDVVCSDLARSRAWYERVLGLEAGPPVRSGPLPGAGFGVTGEVEWEARRLLPPGPDPFALRLVEWKRPRAQGPAYASANHRGLYRMAFLVEDMARAHAELLARGVACPPPVWLDMGPEIPIDGLWACFFPDPDGSCLELIETPKLRA